jgi:hypothetical protein
VVFNNETDTVTRWILWLQALAKGQTFSLNEADSHNSVSVVLVHVRNRIRVVRNAKMRGIQLHTAFLVSRSLTRKPAVFEFWGLA